MAVAVLKAKMMEAAIKGGPGKRYGLPHLTASMLLLKLARLPHCLCW
jgi:hypothetical protein